MNPLIDATSDLADVFNLRQFIFWLGIQVNCVNVQRASGASQGKFTNPALDQNRPTSMQVSLRKLLQKMLTDQNANTPLVLIYTRTEVDIVCQ